MTREHLRKVTTCWAQILCVTSKWRKCGAVGKGDLWGNERCPGGTIMYTLPNVFKHIEC